MDPQKCSVCIIESVDGTHLGVQTCGACCAFFRRAVIGRKNFRCLNNALCGKTQRILNRRMCKYCRFQKCLQAGMDPKDVNRRRNQKLVEASPNHDMEQLKISPVSHSPAEIDSLGDSSILRQIRTAQRSLDAEHFYRYYRNQDSNDGRVTFMQHARLFEQEVKLIGRVMSSMAILDVLSDTDKEKVFSSAMIPWSKFDAALITCRNGGTYTNRTYQVDGAAIVISDDFLMKYYADLLPHLQQKSGAAFEIIVSCAKPVHAMQCREVAERLRLAKLDEVEKSALIGLFLCRDQHLAKLSVRGHEYLLDTRRRIFLELKAHLESTGQNAAERLAHLILLLDPIFMVDIMMKQFLCILMTQTKNVLEENSRKLIQMVERWNV